MEWMLGSDLHIFVEIIPGIGFFFIFFSRCLYFFLEAEAPSLTFPLRRESKIILPPCP